MDSLTIKGQEQSAESITVPVSETGNAFFAALAPSVVPSVSSKAPPPRADWPMTLEQWEPLRKQALERLAAFHRSFAQPIRIVDDEIEINESAMVAEKPYVIEYKGELLEFILKANGSITISEVHIK